MTFGTVLDHPDGVTVVYTTSQSGDNDFFLLPGLLDGPDSLDAVRMIMRDVYGYDDEMIETEMDDFNAVQFAR